MDKKSLRFLILGAGIQGTAAAFDLARSSGLDNQNSTYEGIKCHVTLADMSIDAAQKSVIKASENLNDSCGSITAAKIDVSKEEAVFDLIKGHDAVISAVPYRYNALLASAAIKAGAHFCDLGGNNDIVDQELNMDFSAKEAGVTIIPDCGLAPGVVSVLSALAISDLEQAESVKIRVGGIPVNPKPPLNYQIAFSVNGLINEYIEPARILRDGKELVIPSLTEIENIEFPEPFGILEAFQTSGGCSTLTRTMANTVKNLDYKTIRWPGHCEKISAFNDLGFFSSAEISINEAQISPRVLSEHMLQKALNHQEDDVILMRVSAEGMLNNSHAISTYESIEYPDHENGFSAMARMTAYPAAITALMMARGEINKPGAIPQELCIHGNRMIEELKIRGIKVTKTVKNL